MEVAYLSDLVSPKCKKKGVNSLNIVNMVQGPILLAQV